MKKKIFNNISLKILALLAAIVIWVVVVSTNDPIAEKTYRSLKVTIENENVVEDEGKNYTIEEDRVNVTVKAPRSVLSSIHENDIVLKADMEEMTLESMIPVRATIPAYGARCREITVYPVNIQVDVTEVNPVIEEPEEKETEKAKSETEKQKTEKEE